MGKPVLSGKKSRVFTGLLAIALVATACTGGSSSTTTSTSDGATTGPSTSAATGLGATPAECSTSEGGVDWRSDETVTVEPIGTDSGFEIYAAVYPVPGPTDGLWSQWGQAAVLPDGRHFSAVGDHVGAGGNSFFYVYDPGLRTLSRFMDVLSLADHDPAAGGYGKVHAQMRVDQCGTLWATTYWGSRRQVEYGDGYEGDLLLEFDPNREVVVNHGPVAGRRGIPSLMISSDGRTLVGEANSPEREGLLVVFDTVNRTIVDEIEDERHMGFRSLATMADGSILYSVGNGALAEYAPGEGTTEQTIEGMPGESLRAVTPPGPDGTIYAMSNREPGFFSIAADGTIEAIGDPQGYTTSLALSPDGRFVYWLPGAHGSSYSSGATVLSYDTQTGQTAEVVSVASVVEEALGLRVGGTYSIVYADDRLYLGLNASELSDDSGFGNVVFLVVEGF